MLISNKNQNTQNCLKYNLTLPAATGVAVVAASAQQYFHAWLLMLQCTEYMLLLRYITLLQVLQYLSGMPR